MTELHVFQFTFTPPQHFLYFFPEPQGHGSLRPTLGAVEIVILHSYLDGIFFPLLMYSNVRFILHLC